MRAMPQLVSAPLNPIPIANVHSMTHNSPTMHIITYPPSLPPPPASTTSSSLTVPSVFDYYTLIYTSLKAIKHWH